MTFSIKPKLFTSSLINFLLSEAKTAEKHYLFQALFFAESAYDSQAVFEGL